MSLVDTFQDLVTQVPELVQPFIVSVAAMVPFVEGEGGVTIGIVGGIDPVVAALAAMVGNFVAVTVVVLLSASARGAVVNHRARSRQRGAVLVGSGPAQDAAPAPRPDGDRRTARRAKFQRAYERYGVPGVSLLGPLLLPTHFTASMLVASGVGKVRVLVWQAVAIVAWTTLTAVLVTRLLGFAS